MHQKLLEKRRASLSFDTVGDTPVTLVVLGATGDLIARKIIPSLFQLWRNGMLQKHFRVVGFSRRELSDKDFRAHVEKVLASRPEMKATARERTEFARVFSYVQGFFDDASSYRKLSEYLLDLEQGSAHNRIFYLAVPPSLYHGIMRHLDSSGLAKERPDSFTRIIVEKPFGHDLKSARELDVLLGLAFREEQIYRIDHYLGKEILQNILPFRFSNNLFEPIWSNEHIAKIHIRVFETAGAEKRGAFYETVGALKDMGQNHLLLMLALVTMEQPGSLTSEEVRKSRARILQTLAPTSLSDIKSSTFRAQYEGYREHESVSKSSQTETYFRIEGRLDHPRWRGVPIVMESGKRMGEDRTEIEVVFRHSTPCLCPPGGRHFVDRMVIQHEPHERITIYFWAKKPGFEYEVEERTFDFVLRDTGMQSQYTEEYEKLLWDCINGDQTMFVSKDEVRAMWRFIDPIIVAWQKDAVPLLYYTQGTMESTEAAAARTRSSLKEVGVVGLGKMGGGVARHLLEQDWKVVGYNRTATVTKEFAKEGLLPAGSLKELAEALTPPRTVWVMVPAGEATEEMIFGKEGLVSVLEKGDVIVEAGNSYYKDSVRRAAKLKRLGIRFVDAGVSGGPSGARYGASIMIGGEEKDFRALEPVWRALSKPGGYQFFPGAGAGHFVKMVHNGIEYGMMQALAEGFAVLKKVNYHLDLTRVTDIYNRGSVIESRLVSWLKEAFELYGEDLKQISSTVAHTGEGEWTVRTAREMKIRARVIEGALTFRKESAKNPSYMGKVLSALRNRFGGHEARGERKK